MTASFETMAAKGNLHPQGHTSKVEGPWDLRIGDKSQNGVVRCWWILSCAKSRHVLLAVDQPRAGSNFTLIYVLYLRSGTKKPSLITGLTFHKAREYRLATGVIKVRIKRRYGHSFPCPLPIGRYTGSCIYDVEGGFAVFTLQAGTIRDFKEPEPLKPKTIITPGDAEHGQSLADIKRAFPGTDGLEGRGTDAGGLRNG